MKLDGTQPNLRPVLKFHGHDSLAVDKGAIGGIEIVQLVIITGAHQNAMLLRYIVIPNANRIIRGAPNGNKIIG
ncbi:MAG TPA: hypothetical protein VL171_03020 [Verrucomicrobiae bacterium]|nr:hypothetical protein [Verrucomicrobiae bacterium]